MSDYTAADLENAKACMRLDAGPDWIANVAAALAAEREACALLCKEHIANLSRVWVKGIHAKTKVRFATLAPSVQDEIRAEERGEKTAAEMIEKAIRARGK